MPYNDSRISNYLDLSPIGDSVKETESNYSIYVKPAVKQEIKTLNTIYDNVQDGLLTESQAFILLNYITNKEEFFDDAISMSYCDDQKKVPVLEDVGFIGSKILEKEEILNADHGNSFYTPYSFERTFSSDDTLGEYMTEYADALLENFDEYEKSHGNRGFSEFERVFYEADPGISISIPEYLYAIIEAHSINGNLNPSDGVILKSFIENAFSEFSMDSIGSGIIEVGGIHKPIGSLVVTNIEDELDTIEEYMEMASERLLRESGWYVDESTKNHKNDVVFDSVAKKLFTKLKDHIHLTVPNDEDTSFKQGLNTQKNRYFFSFKDTNNKKDEADIKNIIISCGFTPSKGEKDSITYSNKTNDYTFYVEFHSIKSGISIWYKLESKSNDEEVEESTEYDYTQLSTNEYYEAIKDIFDSMEYIHYESSDDTIEEDIELINALKENRDQLSAQNFVLNNNPIIEEKSEVLISELEQACHDINKSLQRVPNLIIKESADDTLFEILDNNPTIQVKRLAMNVFDSLYNESSQDIEFHELVKMFANALKSQLYDEAVCEIVLDDVDFKKSYFSEAKDHASKDEIDPEIRPIIDLLNKLGYKTKYSCAGHYRSRSKEDGKRDGVYYGKLYTTARITFDGNYKLPSIPDGWYEGLQSDKTAIYVRPFSYDAKKGNADRAFEKWKNAYMKSLKTWAENLPPRKE